MSPTPSHGQKLGREGALLVLFGIDVADHSPEEALEGSRPLVAEVDDEILEYWQFVEERVGGVCSSREEVDERVQEDSPKWRISRMDIVDRNLLRIGAWELFDSGILPIITINACVELAKSYGEESTPGFVNGLLDQICTDHDIEVS
ncbi:MAG: transcription antitermination factor NusB [Bradymonadaceae bacterium]